MSKPNFEPIGNLTMKSAQTEVLMHVFRVGNSKFYIKKEGSSSNPRGINLKKFIRENKSEIVKSDIPATLVA